MIEYIFSIILATQTVIVQNPHFAPRTIEPYIMASLPREGVKTPPASKSERIRHSVSRDPLPNAKTKIKNGKLYCAKKNDKPHKSKTHKKKHLDMECCLDPDEIKNSNCNYE